MLGKIEGRRRRGRKRMNGINDSADMSLNKLWEIVKDRKAWHAAVHGLQSVGLSGLKTTKHEKEHNAVMYKNATDINF